jgi:hypothetical protein
MTVAFAKATKTRARARVALIGPAGSGKTYSALRLARGLAGPAGRIAVVDTERGSASKYAGPFDFDVLELEEFDPRAYVDAVRAAEQAGYDVLIIDSLSHAWSGKGGALELKDAAAKRKGGDSFGAWRDVTPLHNAMVDAIVSARLHVVATMRAKTEYLVERYDRTGKNSVRKVGLAPEQRAGIEYEFDLVGDLDADANLVVTKTRCPAFHGMVINQPSEQAGAALRDWLTDGAEVPAPAAPAQGDAEAPSVRFYEDGIPTDAIIERLADREDARELVSGAGPKFKAAVKQAGAAKAGTWQQLWKSEDLSLWTVVLLEAKRALANVAAVDEAHDGQAAAAG